MTDGIHSEFMKRRYHIWSIYVHRTRVVKRKENDLGTDYSYRPLPPTPPTTTTQQIQFLRKQHRHACHNRLHKYDIGTYSAGVVRCKLQCYACLEINARPSNASECIACICARLGFTPAATQRNAIGGALKETWRVTVAGKDKLNAYWTATSYLIVSGIFAYSYYYYYNCYER